MLRDSILYRYYLELLLIFDFYFESVYFASHVLRLLYSSFYALTTFSLASSALGLLAQPLFSTVHNQTCLGTHQLNNYVFILFCIAFPIIICRTAAQLPIASSQYVKFSEILKLSLRRRTRSFFSARCVQRYFLR